MQQRLETRPKRLLARPWFLAFVPINAATSGFSVSLPLLILVSLGGSTLDVALAAALFNAVVIPASMLWGYLSDRYPDRRRAFLVLNFGAFAILYTLVGLLPGVGSLPPRSTLDLVFGINMALALIAPSGASAGNLLVLERFGVSERANAFASYQEMQIFGSIGGVLVGYFWLVSHHALAPLLFVLAGLAATSVAAIRLGLQPQAGRLTTSHVARHPESFVSRVRHLAGWAGGFVPFFPKRPGLAPGATRRFARWIRGEMHHEFPLILAASMLFNVSSNLFNTSYTPYLYGIGISTASIFLVSFSNNAAQGLAFPFSGSLSNREGADRLVQQASYVRALGYLAVVAFTFVPMTATGALNANVLAYAILGGAIAFYSTASNLILFRTLQGRDAGSLLGVNSALGGVAAVVGASLSGVLSTFGSYRLTFFVAGLGLLASLPIWALVRVAYRRRAGLPVREFAPPPRGPVERAPGPIASVD
jgi:MFS family permease